MEKSIFTAHDYEISEIPDLDLTRNKLESEGIFVQNVHNIMDRNIGFSIIGNNTLDDLIGFIKKTNTSIVMIDTVYLDKESYKIDLELEEDEFFLQKDVDDFNESLERIDFSKPYDVFLYFFYEGSSFGILYQNSELMKLASLSAEDRIIQFEKEHGEEYNKMLEERSRKTQDIENQLVENIANSPGFQFCTNQTLRSDFLINFFKKPENNEAKKLLQNEFGFIGASTYKRLGDKAWVVVKVRKN